MSITCVHFSQISFPVRYSVVKLRLESRLLRFREVIYCLDIFLQFLTIQELINMTKSRPHHRRITVVMTQCEK